MDVEKFGVYMVMLFIGIAVTYILATSVLIPKKIEAASATDVIDRTAALSLSEPEIALSSKTTGDGFEYDITAVFNMRFDSKEAEQITVFPVVRFKGVKDRDTGLNDITIKKGETKRVTFNFKLQSEEWPMIVKDKDTEFSCALDSCIHHGQVLLLKNFFFSFAGRQIDPSELPFAPPGLPKIGPCVLSTEIQCPSDKKVVNLKLDDEGKKCDKQKEENKKDCDKTEKLCGTLVSTRLNKIIADESLIEKILPVTPSCKDKIFDVSIKTGEVNENIVGGNFRWKVGEDITFSFWQKSKGRENCWSELAAGCTDLYTTEKTVTIPIESYVVAK